jgi:hypothetical protein
MDNTQNKEQMPIVSYETEKVQNLLNILNNIQFQGIQQAQLVMQIATILSNPIKTKENNNEQ